jgi:hypothetical protein
MKPWPNFADTLPQDAVFNAMVNLDSTAGMRGLGELYDRNRPDLVPARPEPSIPKIIHQIWLGSPVPRKLRRYSESWRKHHPDWDFRIWTDRDVADFDFGTRELYEAADCWGQKSDLLRVEILNKVGGVYVDFDYLSYKPIDLLVERYDFFTTLKYIFTAHLGWPAVWPDPIVACNSLMGSRPGHPILSAYLERVSTRWNDRERYELTDNELMPIAIAAMGGRKNAARMKSTGVRTFLPFGEIVAELAGTNEDSDIVLPPVFFNPVMTGARTLYLMPDFWQRCRSNGVRWPSLRTYTRPHKLSLAYHVQENSWI